MSRITAVYLVASFFDLSDAEIDSLPDTELYELAEQIAKDC